VWGYRRDNQARLHSSRGKRVCLDDALPRGRRATTEYPPEVKKEKKGGQRWVHCCIPSNNGRTASCRRLVPHKQNPC